MPACLFPCPFISYTSFEKKKSINKQTIIRVKNERTGDEAGDSVPSSSSSSAVNRRHHFPHTMVNTALYADREKLGRGGLAEQKQRPFSQDVGGRGEGREGRREGEERGGGKKGRDKRITGKIRGKGREKRERERRKEREKKCERKRKRDKQRKREMLK